MRNYSNAKHQTTLEFDKLRRQCNKLASRDRQLTREVASLRRQVASLKSTVEMDLGSKRKQRKIEAYSTIINIQAKLIKTYEENKQLKKAPDFSDTTIFE